MSQEPPPENLNQALEPQNQKEAQESSPPVKEVEQQLQAAIKNLPPQEQEKVRHVFTETMMGFFQSGGGTKLDPETAKILAATVEKDNEYKFQYLSLKEKNEAEARKREDDHEATQWRDKVALSKPILYISLIVIPVCLFIGIWLAATGREMLGSNLITAVLTGLFAFLAGLGTSNLFKKK